MWTELRSHISIVPRYTYVPTFHLLLCWNLFNMIDWFRWPTQASIITLGYYFGPRTGWLPTCKPKTKSLQSVWVGLGWFGSVQFFDAHSRRNGTAGHMMPHATPCRAILSRRGDWLAWSAIFRTNSPSASVVVVVVVNVNLHIVSFCVTSSTDESRSVCFYFSEFFALWSYVCDLL